MFKDLRNMIFWNPHWKERPPDYPEQSTVGYESHQICGTDTDPWASGYQRIVDDAKHWGETVGTLDAKQESERLYEPSIIQFK